MKIPIYITRADTILESDLFPKPGDFVGSFPVSNQDHYHSSLLYSLLNTGGSGVYIMSTLIFASHIYPSDQTKRPEIIYANNNNRSGYDL